MHGFATLQQMVNQACHQAEGSEAFSPAALHAVHKLNRCLMEVPSYDQAVLFAERAVSLGPLPESLLRLLCSGAPAAMLLASNCLHLLSASTQVAKQCGEVGLVETVLGLLKGGGRGLEPALVESLLQLLVTSTETDVQQRVTLGSLRGVVNLLATLLGGAEFLQSRVSALELLKVVLLSRKGLAAARASVGLRSALTALSEQPSADNTASLLASVERSLRVTTLAKQ